MVCSEMDKKNITLFLGMLAVMAAIVGTDMLSPGLDIEEVGKPVVRPPFAYSEDYKDYNITFNEDEIIIDLSPEVAGEYEGSFLSVYAYDVEGNHISKLKRVVNGKILIDREESPSFQVSFTDGVVSGMVKGNKEASFCRILKEARDSKRYFGLARCLLGRQCIKICPVAAVHALVKDTSPEGKGRIIPDITYNKCILGGLCAARCPTNLIIVEENEPE